MRDKEAQLIWEAYDVKVNENHPSTYELTGADPDVGTYIDIQNDYLSPDTYAAGLDQEAITALISEHGTLEFIVHLTGVDPNYDGTESYYTFNVPGMTDQLANLVAAGGEDYTETASQIANGVMTQYMLKSGLYDNIVFFVEPGGDGLGSLRRFLDGTL